MLHIALLLVIKTANVNGFSSGAPLVACRDLFPQHAGANSLPFNLFSVNATEFVDHIYIPNQLYNSKYVTVPMASYSFSANVYIYHNMWL